MNLNFFLIVLTVLLSTAAVTGTGGQENPGLARHGYLRPGGSADCGFLTSAYSLRSHAISQQYYPGQKPKNENASEPVKAKRNPRTAEKSVLAEADEYNRNMNFREAEYLLQNAQAEFPDSEKIRKKILLTRALIGCSEGYSALLSGNRPRADACFAKARESAKASEVEFLVRYYYALYYLGAGKYAEADEKMSEADAYAGYPNELARLSGRIKARKKFGDAKLAFQAGKFRNCADVCKTVLRLDASFQEADELLKNAEKQLELEQEREKIQPKEKAVFCSQCGKKSPDIAGKFCPFCGKELGLKGKNGGK